MSWSRCASDQCIDRYLPKTAPAVKKLETIVGIPSIVPASYIPFYRSSKLLLRSVGGHRSCDICKFHIWNFYESDAVGQVAIWVNLALFTI